MVQVNSIDELKRLLITTQLVRLEQWKQVEKQIANGEGVADVLKLMERQQVLTSLQTQRIQKGDTEGLVLGNYKLLYRNASGSFARVYRAATLDDNRVVAVKLLRERWAADPEAVAGFHREARICQKFHHPNIVPILDVGSDRGFHYFTMDFVEGGNLRDFMRIRQTLSPGEAAKCMYDVCAGLEYALTHHGVTHRDLKATNVLMDTNGVAKLVDFGLAGADSPSQVGTSDDVHRALEYASLERGTNAPNNDPRSDLFFAGAIMYELLSGESAWPRTRDREERKQLSRYTNTPRLSTIRANLPDCVTSIVDKLMEVGPSDRYQSATEAMVDLKAALVQLGEWQGGEDADTQVNEIPARPFQLLVVDSVKKRITALREYFTRHEMKIEFVAHPDVALSRLKSTDPPDGILVLADNFTEETISCYPQIQAYARSCKVHALAVFPQEERERVGKAIRATKFGATAFQPATLREIRNHFEEAGAVTR